MLWLLGFLLAMTAILIVLIVRAPLRDDLTDRDQDRTIEVAESEPEPEPEPKRGAKCVL